MKHWILLAAWLLARVAVARPAVAPPDTLAGHARLVGIFSESLCSKLQAASTRLDFEQLPPRQSGRLLNRVFEEIVLENRKELEAFQKQLPRSARTAYWQRVGREALLRLLDTCPKASAWLIELNRQSLSDKSPLSEPERQALLPAATDICQRLEADHSLDERFTKAESSTLVGQTFQQALLAHAPELVAYYGEGLTSDPRQLGSVVERLTLVMFTICPKSPLLLTLKLNN